MSFPGSSLAHMYVSILRCSSWCNWPEHYQALSRGFAIPLSDPNSVGASVHIATYSARPRPEDTAARELEKGLLVWRGKMDSGYWAGDSFIKAPEDKVLVAIPYERPYEGDVDIQLHIGADNEIALADLLEPASALSMSVLSYLNLTCGEMLVPVGPLQISKLDETGRSIQNTFTMSVCNRPPIETDSLPNILNQYVTKCITGDGTVSGGVEAAKLKTALEVYSAYFYEKSKAVRFLVLIMVLEVLTEAQLRPPIVQGMLSSWSAEIHNLKNTLDPQSDDFASLENIEREILFKRHSSIRGQIRSLVRSSLECASDPRANDLASQAVKAYDKRSQLVHEGTLPASEFRDLEKMSREIVTAVLAAKLGVTRDSRTGVYAVSVSIGAGNKAPEPGC